MGYFVLLMSHNIVYQLIFSFYSVLCVFSVGVGQLSDSCRPDVTLTAGAFSSVTSLLLVFITFSHLFCLFYAIVKTGPVLYVFLELLNNLCNVIISLDSLIAYN